MTLESKQALNYFLSNLARLVLFYIVLLSIKILITHSKRYTFSIKQG